MIKSKLYDLIKMRLGNRTDTDIDTRIAAEMDMAQYELEHHGDFTPWFLLSEDATYAVTAAEQRVPIPADMLQEFEDGALFYGYDPLVKYDYDALVEKFQNSVGPPKAYALVNDYFIVFPVPDAAYNVRMKYYKTDTLPSVVLTSAENLWMKNAAHWLIAKTGSAIARYIKDADATALFLADEQKAQAAVYKIHIDRAERNLDRQMGDD
jgi:hypothetical protein